METSKKPSISRFHVFWGEKRMLYVNGGINETEKTQESVSNEESINVFLDQRRFEQLYAWCDQLENWLEQRSLFSEGLALKETFTVEFRKYNKDLPHQKRALILDAMQKILIEMYQRLGGNLTLSPAERNRFSEAKGTIWRVYHARSDIYRAFEQELAYTKSAQEKILIAFRYEALAKKEEGDSKRSRLENIRKQYRALCDILRGNLMKRSEYPVVTMEPPMYRFLGRQRTSSYGADDVRDYVEADLGWQRVRAEQEMEGNLRKILGDEGVLLFQKGRPTFFNEDSKGAFIQMVARSVEKILKLQEEMEKIK